MHNNPPRVTLDFETRSECDLRTSGSWRYSLDVTTEPLCLGYRLPYWDEGRTGLWYPAMPWLGIDSEGESFADLTELFEWITAGELIEAHNAWFERGIWRNKMEVVGWPRIADHQWRCSAAKAAAHSLPRSLDGAGEALNLSVTKDLEGHKVMKKMAKPRKALKAEITAWGRKHAGCEMCYATGKVSGISAETGRKKNVPCPVCMGRGYNSRASIPSMPTLYHESIELMVTLFDYVRQDVLAEEAISSTLPDLNESETRIYLLDQEVNERGFAVDTEAVAAALDVIDLESVTLNAELAELTEGAVEKATQRARLTAWMEGQGVSLDNTQGDYIDSILEGETNLPELEPKPRRALELMRTLGRASTAKYERMRDWVCPDGRVRGGLLYHGAGTGRWSGAGVQPHNFPRGNGDLDMEAAWAAIKSRDQETIRAVIRNPKTLDPYNDVMEVLSHSLRGAIVAAPGKTLYVADYASIEARVLLWQAGDEEALDIFRSGADIYCYMADDIYGYKTNKKDHPNERHIGKAAVLGLGYQMGAKKFIDTAAKGGATIEEAFAEKIVATYREKFWRVKEMWARQEHCAIEAVLYPGDEVSADYVTWVFEEPFLYCILPSGRRLAYPEPEIRSKMMPWGKLKEVLTFMGVNPYNRQWMRQTTYGGMLVENEVQAMARDLIASAMERCAVSSRYQPILTVHDELIAEADEGTGNVKEFEQLVARNPTWAKGLPVAAEGWSGKRYRK